MHIIALFFPISRSSNDEKYKGGQEGEGDVMVEMEVDEKRQVISGVQVLKLSVLALL